MKITAELPIECEMHEIPPLDALEKEDAFKKLMGKQTTKPSHEKKTPFSFLALLEQEQEEIYPLLEEKFSLEEEKEEPSKEKKTSQLQNIAPFAAPAPFFFLPNQTIVAAASPAQSVPDVSALFEKIGSEMIVMTSEGSTKTTLVLGGDMPLSSMWKDAEITIEEFSSAPKIFNVKISAAPEALGLVRTHIEEFLKLFQERKFGFSINRIDTELSSSRPIFSRKEKIDKESGGDQQGRHKQ